MPNTFNNTKSVGGKISSLAAAMLSNKCHVANSIDKEDPSVFGANSAYSEGDTIQINKNARFTVGSNADVTSAIQDIKEERVPLALDIRRVIAVQVSSAELASEIALKAWAKRVLNPAMDNMAAFIEAEMLSRMTRATYNAVGTPGSTTFDTDLVLQAGQKIDENACPTGDDRFLFLNPAANRSAVNARKGLFQSSEDIAKQYKKGYMGDADGFSFIRSNLLPSHTNGNDVTFAVQTTVSTEGQSTLVVNGLTTSPNGTITRGTVFTIDGVFAVDPITKTTLPSLQQFVVTADVTGSSGSATVSVSPAFFSSASGSLQNISAFPQASATVTPLGAANTGYRQNLAFQKQAFRMVSVPLVEPDGVDMIGQSTVNGFTIRVIRDYDVLKDQLIMRLDFLGGLAATRPEWACRLYS